MLILIILQCGFEFMIIHPICLNSQNMKTDFIIGRTEYKKKLF